MSGGIAKPYLTSYVGGQVDVLLNDGRCKVQENELFYLFHTSRNASDCGTEMRVRNQTVDLIHSLATELHYLSRLTWKFCMFYARNHLTGPSLFAQVNTTHIEFKNTFNVTLNKKQTISRWDLKVVWKCVYPLYYTYKAHISLEMEW